MMGDKFVLVLAAAGLALVTLLSLPAAIVTAELLTKRATKRRICQYEDKDGKASQESLESFTAKFPKTFVLVFAAATCGLSFAAAVVSSVDESLFLDNWLIAGSSVGQIPI